MDLLGFEQTFFATLKDSQQRGEGQKEHVHPKMKRERMEKLK